MDISMKWNRVCGNIPAIISKSDAHRALIAAALSDKPTRFKISLFSKDIDATLSCLKSLGVTVSTYNDSIIVAPIGKRVLNPELDCNESGSTLRFLIPVAAAVSENPKFVGRGRLSQRPLTPLISTMTENGCSFSSESLPLSISGKLSSGDFVLPGDISSQFITGLLFALPLLDGDSTITLSSPLQSAAYVDMTLDTLTQFNIDIKKTTDKFLIKGNQRYISPGEYKIEGDWSNIAPFMAAAALSGEITAYGFNPESKQSDIEILSIIKAFGADIQYSAPEYSVASQTASPLSIDVSQFPDLFPVIAVLLCGANGKSLLYNAKRLRIKESDRIESTLTLIKNLGGTAEATNDSLTIYGTGTLIGGKCDSFNDHRIVMAAAVASLISEKEVIINNAEAINKSFPDFFEYFKQTGGTYNVI